MGLGLWASYPPVDMGVMLGIWYIYVDKSGNEKNPTLFCYTMLIN
jgi:hypothetical protein